jgi:hypothetical protein
VAAGVDGHAIDHRFRTHLEPGGGGEGARRGAGSERRQRTRARFASWSIRITIRLSRPKRVLKVAGAVSANRALLLRQVRALAQSSLKSTLDVSFAEVGRFGGRTGAGARRERRRSQARLSAALG